MDDDGHTACNHISGVDYGIRAALIEQSAEHQAAGVPPLDTFCYTYNSSLICVIFLDWEHED